MEDKQTQLQRRVNKMIDDVEAKHLRTMQKATYLCMSNCHDDKSTRQELTGCMSRCRSAVEGAEQAINTEMSQFQSRLQRAVLACRDESNDRLREAGKHGDEMTVEGQRQLERCLGGVLDTHIAMVDQIQKRLETSFKAYGKK